MIVMRMPVAGGGETWVVSHRLTVASERARDFRPIHVLTFLGQHLVRDKQPMFSACMALENKLSAVRYQLSEYRRAWASYGDFLYPPLYVRSYEPDQRIIASLEAYLNAIYGTLEITARINKLIHPDLRQGFREQSRKVKLFRLKDRKWLGRFYDLRTELSHYGTPLPLIQSGNLLIEFHNAQKLESFTKGRHEVSLSEPIAYSMGLLDMLDEWAKAELQEIDPAGTVDTATIRAFDKPLRMSKTKVRDLLRLVKRSRPRKVGFQVTEAPTRSSSELSEQGEAGE